VTWRAGRQPGDRANRSPQARIPKAGTGFRNAPFASEILALHDGSVWPHGALLHRRRV